jgi:hypothetical protein
LGVYSSTKRYNPQLDGLAGVVTAMGVDLFVYHAI